MIPIIVPYTKLHELTIKAVPDATFIRMEDDDHYRRLMRSLWERGEAFILVEHDVVPTQVQLSALADCTEPWCHYGYCPGDWIPTFGCVRFSAELISNTPGAFADVSWPWGQLDAKFHVFAREAGMTPHWHSPHVLHCGFHVIDGPSFQKIRLTREQELYILQAEIEMVKAELEKEPV